MKHESVTGFVVKDSDAYAVYLAEWHPRHSEAYVDVILGSFEEPEYADNVTFGCRIGHVPSQAEPACSLVPAAAARSDHRIFGRKLAQDEAMVHPRLSEFWTVIDWLIFNDPLLHKHVFHMSPRTSGHRRRWFKRGVR